MCQKERVRTLILLFGLVTACGGGPDDWPDGRPKIDRLRFMQQSPQDPYALEFLIEFTDTDGDMGGGTLHLSVAGNKTSELALMELFQKQTPPVPLDATAGDLEVVVRMSKEVEIGDEIRVGFLIEDAAGGLSNDPWIDMKALAE